MPTQSHPTTDTAPSRRRALIAQAGRFGLVGIANTIIDFIISAIIANVLGGSVIYANIFGFTFTGVIIGSVLGGCIAMVNSYFLNMRFTFKAHDKSLRQAILFFVITGFGLIVLRPIVIHAFTDWWTVPVDLTYFPSQVIGLKLSRDLIFELVGVASAILIIWPYNFILYKRVVFKKGQD